MTMPVFKRPTTDTEAIGWLTINVGKIVLPFVGIAWGVLMYAWALRALWAWFVVPAFHVAPISLATAAGLYLIAALLRAAPATDLQDDKRTFGQKLGRVFAWATFYPTLIWVIGWMVAQ